ncbi:hypothetical protein NLU13_2068 [Sarocladium strictum]|uniref:Uncharacterized protein n=1 Tax=Sarocladium strictum TaxID=5046 RepID=A0AA39GS44_SARSR|nr:hypothetical protein NLU13_2068 [Sarocladium strictum]
MMSSLQPGMTTRARALRNLQGPKTPEPLSDGQGCPSSPPRPRFRLKRRNAPHLHAPTQQFLASVAAADIPIPSIEEPHVVDEEMVDMVYPVIPSLHDIESMEFMDNSLRGRTFSAPKTPAPGAVPSLSPKRYPDWSIGSTASDLESSPECESSRPSTARSTQTSASLFSRYSVTSEELSQCVSPEMERPEPLAASPILGPGDKTLRPIYRTSRSRKAPWTKQMSQHLWFTYMMYLQDPKVTPFRANKSGIPPPGVCSRVAREAKRSWKGSKSQKANVAMSGSNTPTGDGATAFMQWPHTCAATRAHLRELCKLNASSTGLSRQFFAHSPTPFGRTTTATRFLNRRSNNARSPSVFSGKDMAVSLTVSTADSMQLQGPLAQLTSSQDDITPDPSMTPIQSIQVPPAAPQTPPPVMRRLGSPFAARSYGPSSSSSLGAAFGSSLDNGRQNQTLGPRRSLRSPVMMGDSNLSSQKRPFGQPSAEPRKSKRPSLATDLWTEPPATAPQHVQPSPYSQPVIVEKRRSEDFNGPRTNLQELFDAPQPRAPPTTLVPQAKEVIGESRARLGSPFSASSSSHSFPHRVLSSSGMGLGVIRRPFATIQQTSEGQATPAARPSLASRLAYIDERLRDFRHRDRARQQNQPSL